MHQGMQPPTLGKAAHTSVTDLCAGKHTSGYLHQGRVYTFGTGPSLGQGLGVASSPTPKEVPLESPGASRLFLGEGTGVALHASTRSPLVWGTGSEGQLGLGGAMGPVGSYHGGQQSQLVASPRALQGEPLLSAALSRHRTLLLGENGLVYATGSGFCGELGVATTSGVVTSPASIVGLPDASSDRVVGIAAGLTFSLAATASGQLYFWGQLGHPGSAGALRHASPTPLPLPGHTPGSPLMLAAAGQGALVTDGQRLWALGCSWRDGGFGGAEGPVRPRPVPLPYGARSITFVAAGPHTVGLVTDCAQVWLAGRLDSAFLLGGEVGAGAQAWHEQQLAVAAGGAVAGAAGAGVAAGAPKLSRASLLEELGLEEEIGAGGAHGGDGLHTSATGHLYAPRLVKVLDKALPAVSAGKRRVVELAIGSAHALIAVE